MQEVLSSNKMLMVAVGKIVKMHRLSTGKSIYAISAECGLSKATWREVEIANGNNITLTTLWKIAYGLDIPLAQIIDEARQELGDNFILSDD